MLDYQNWYELGHGIQGGRKNEKGLWWPIEVPEGWFLWAPPPAIADVAVEELEASRHKRPHLNHVFIAPRLMTYAWQKNLQKICDVVFVLPAGSRPCWPLLEHEPLIVGLTLCFSSCSPWQFN